MKTFKNPAPQKLRRMAEFVTLFFMLPAALHTVIHKTSPLPFLVIFSMVSAFYLYQAQKFDKSTFWNMKAAILELPRILLIFVPIGALLFAFVWRIYPNFLFDFPRHHPALWKSIMWSYPLIAVYPQEMIYRGFFFNRYATLFSHPGSLIAASAVAFSFGHIIYYHPYSLLLTLGGGALFSYTYWKSNSLLAATVEHALYGCFLYTVGLGRFFLTGFDKLIS